MRFTPLGTRSALALVIGALALSASPVVAKEKKKKEEPAAAAAPAISPSKGYLPEAKKVQTAFQAKDAVALEAALTAADAFATTPQDKYLQSQFRLQLGLLKSDQTLQAAALDGMIDSGIMPAGDAARFNFFSGQFAYNKKDYTKVISRMLAAKAAGSKERDLPLLLMDSYLRTEQLDNAVAVAKEAIMAQRAAGARPSDDYYVRTAQALQKANRRPELLEMLSMRVQDYPQPNIWRNTLFIHMQGADKDMTLDTLRLMRNVGAITDKSEVLEYVALATEGGLPGEVLMVIDEARAKGLVPASDAKFKEIYDTQKARTVGDKSALDADAAKGAALPSARRARSTADALFGYGDYTRAAALYQVALDKGDAEVDLTTLRLGVSQYLAGNADAAKVTLGSVGNARKALANLWMINIATRAAAAAAPAAPAVPATTTGR
jgi:hypothetical protein